MSENINEIFAALKESGLAAFEHEDGWVLTTKEVWHKLMQRRDDEPAQH